MQKAELLQTKLSVLNEIASAIVGTHNISSIANLILELAINHTNADKGSLMLINEQDELYILAARGMDIEFINTYRVKVGEGIAGMIVEGRTPVIVQDITQDDRFTGTGRDRYKTRSFIACPIISKDKVHGLICINDKKEGTPFSEDELVLLQIIANQAAVALENASLMTLLRARAADLEDLNRKLIEADVAKTEFLTRVSHELRTPLNSMKGAIYYLKKSEKKAGSQQEQFYDIIAHETNNMIGIVENLFEFLRLEDETLLVKKTVLQLPTLLKEIFGSNLIKTSLAKKNIQLYVDVDEELSPIVGDKVKVTQFFINIIEGLKDYLEHGDAVGVYARENGFVEVHLTGPRRLPENIMSTIINAQTPFMVGQKEDGLRLYLASKIAESHRWKLQGENKDDSFVLSVLIPKNVHQKIDAAVTGALDIFVDFMSEMLDVNICSVMLTDEATGELTIKSSRGLENTVIKRTRMKVGDRIAGWVALEGKPLLIEDIETEPRLGRKSIAQYTTKSLLSVPLKINDHVIGVINLNNKKTAESFTQKDLYIASALSDRISSFIARLYAGDLQEEEIRQSMISFEHLLDAEKRYHKKGHLFPHLMAEIMNRLAASEEDKKVALYISSVYDLGLASLAADLIKKKSLSPSEVNLMRSHPYTSVDLLSRFECSDEVKKAILYHHERYDGSGYPDSLKGDAIPFMSRVLAVVDSFCAMITERTYRKTFTKTEALEEIRKGSGTVYDPTVVAALEEAVKSL